MVLGQLIRLRYDKNRLELLKKATVRGNVN